MPGPRLWQAGTRRGITLVVCLLESYMSNRSYTLAKSDASPLDDTWNVTLPDGRKLDFPSIGAATMYIEMLEELTVVEYNG